MRPLLTTWRRRSRAADIIPYALLALLGLSALLR